MHAGRHFCLPPCRFADHRGGGRGGHCPLETPRVAAMSGDDCVWAAPAEWTAGQEGPPPVDRAPALPRATRLAIANVGLPVLRQSPPPSPAPPPPSPETPAPCAGAVAGEPLAMRPPLSHFRLLRHQRQRRRDRWRQARPASARYRLAAFAGGRDAAAAKPSSRCYPPPRARHKPNPHPLRRITLRHCHPHPCRGPSSRQPVQPLPTPLSGLHRHCSGRPRPRHRCGLRQW